MIAAVTRKRATQPIQAIRTALLSLDGKQVSFNTGRPEEKRVSGLPIPVV